MHAFARSPILLALLFAAACDEPGTLPKPQLRTFVAVLADGNPLPSFAPCPAPWTGDNVQSEAWVFFGEGTLTLSPDGSFAWDYRGGGGYRVTVDGQTMQSGRGGGESRAGFWTVDPSGALTMYADAAHTREIGVGRLAADEAELSVAAECPHAPEGTAPHNFRITLR